MDEGEYITSGVLQDYCLGLLTKSEEREVEKMCQAYPEVAKELKLLRFALEEYSKTKKLKDRDQLRLSVWKAVKKLWDERPS